jgi:hypothetical protein
MFQVAHVMSLADPRFPRILIPRFSPGRSPLFRTRGRAPTPPEIRVQPPTPTGSASPAGSRASSPLGDPLPIHDVNPRIPPAVREPRAQAQVMPRRTVSAAVRSKSVPAVTRPRRMLQPGGVLGPQLPRRSSE